MNNISAIPGSNHKSDIDITSEITQLRDSLYELDLLIDRLTSINSAALSTYRFPSDDDINSEIKSISNEISSLIHDKISNLRVKRDIIHRQDPKYEVLEQIKKECSEFLSMSKSLLFTTDELIPTLSGYNFSNDSYVIGHSPESRKLKDLSYEVMIDAPDNTKANILRSVNMLMINCNYDAVLSNSILCNCVHTYGSRIIIPKNNFYYTYSRVHFSLVMEEMFPSFWDLNASKEFYSQPEIREKFKEWFKSLGTDAAYGRWIIKDYVEGGQISNIESLIRLITSLGRVPKELMPIRSKFDVKELVDILQNNFMNHSFGMITDRSTVFINGGYYVFNKSWQTFLSENLFS